MLPYLATTDAADSAGDWAGLWQELEAKMGKLLCGKSPLLLPGGFDDAELGVAFGRRAYFVAGGERAYTSGQPNYTISEEPAFRSAANAASVVEIDDAKWPGVAWCNWPSSGAEMGASIEAHRRTISGSEYWLGWKFGPTLYQQAEKRHSLGVVDFICEGYRSLTVKRVWDKYLLQRFHNLSWDRQLVINFEGLGLEHSLTIDPLGCATVRRLPTEGAPIAPGGVGRYFWPVLEGDIRFYMAGLGAESYPIKAYAAGNVGNPSILWYWWHKLRATGPTTFGWFRSQAGWDAAATQAVDGDVDPLTPPAWVGGADPRAVTTRLGDLVHHRGNLVAMVEKPAGTWTATEVQWPGWASIQPDGMIPIGTVLVVDATNPSSPVLRPRDSGAAKVDVLAPGSNCLYVGPDQQRSASAVDLTAGLALQGPVPWARLKMSGGPGPMGEYVVSEEQVSIDYVPLGVPVGGAPVHDVRSQRRLVPRSASPTIIYTTTDTVFDVLGYLTLNHGMDAVGGNWTPWGPGWCGRFVHRYDVLDWWTHSELGHAIAWAGDTGVVSYADIGFTELAGWPRDGGYFANGFACPPLWLPGGVARTYGAWVASSSAYTRNSPDWTDGVTGGASHADATYLRPLDPRKLPSAVTLQTALATPDGSPEQAALAEFPPACPGMVMQPPDWLWEATRNFRAENWWRDHRSQILSAGSRPYRHDGRGVLAQGDGVFLRLPLTAWHYNAAAWAVNRMEAGRPLTVEDLRFQVAGGAAVLAPNNAGLGPSSIRPANQWSKGYPALNTLCQRLGIRVRGMADLPAGYDAARVAVSIQREAGVQQWSIRTRTTYQDGTAVATGGFPLPWGINWTLHTAVLGLVKINESPALADQDGGTYGIFGDASYDWIATEDVMAWAKGVGVAVARRQLVRPLSLLVDVANEGPTYLFGDGDRDYTEIWADSYFTEDEAVAAIKHKRGSSATGENKFVVPARYVRWVETAADDFAWVADDGYQEYLDDKKWEPPIVNGNAVRNWAGQHRDADWILLDLLSAASGTFVGFAYIRSGKPSVLVSNEYGELRALAMVTDASDGIANNSAAVLTPIGAWKRGFDFAAGSRAKADHVVNHGEAGRPVTWVAPVATAAAVKTTGARTAIVPDHGGPAAVVTVCNPLHVWLDGET